MTQEKHSQKTTAPLAATSADFSCTRFRLTVTQGPDTGKVYVSDSDVVVVGSDVAATFALSDPTVSRFHCELAVVDGDIRLRDLASRNGTVVGKVRIREGLVAPGATLQLGNSDIRFELEGAALRLPLHPSDHFVGMVGRSTVMRRAFSLLESAAQSDVSVVLLGETGTGKDVAAEALHLRSQRHNGPFVVVDCGAIPADLLESELFGHERGAFTGAVDARMGLFEAADGGTLLLDEIGELPLELQPKLLRVLENRTVRRVGGKQHKSIDVRVVAATNRDLRAEVNERRFRADLYYRLNVLEVVLPPLRQRTEDLPLLIEALLRRAGRDQADPDAAALLAEPFVAQLKSHTWPGNVRELRNHIERCLALRDALEPAGLATTPSANDFNIDLDIPLRDARERWSGRFERAYVEAALKDAGDNVTVAARRAGVDRMHFYRLLWKHGLRAHRSHA